MPARRYLKRPSRPAVLLVCVMFLSTILIPGSFAAEISLPEMGAPSGNTLTPAEERRLGQAFMRNIRNTMNVVSDPLLASYIQSLGSNLVQHSDGAGNNFQFFMIEDPQVNAFAGPGGHIGVYTGLLITTQSESELASVLAHEIAHVTQEHLVRTYDAMQRMTLPAAALAIAALVIGAATKSPDAIAAATTGIQAGMAQQQINFTRSHEQEADHIGIQTLAAAGYDPGAMPVFFSRMGQVNHIYDSGKLPEFLRTHPVSSNRIADAYGRAGAFPYRQKADSLDYHLARAKLRIFQFNNPKEAVTHFQETLSERRFRNEDGHRYGYALALMTHREFDRARAEIDRLLQQHPEQIDFIIASALIEKHAGNEQLGLQILNRARDSHPQNYPLAIYHTEALLDAGKPAEALAILEKQAALRPNDTTLYKLLARAAGDSGDRASGHRYLAEYYYASGALRSAKQQLEAGLEIRGLDYYQSARMAARLKEIRQEETDLRTREKE
jgi:predicted Zn-dependent protease